MTQVAALNIPYSTSHNILVIVELLESDVRCETVCAVSTAVEVLERSQLIDVKYKLLHVDTRLWRSM
jgi:hypothetical protein